MSEPVSSGRPPGARRASRSVRLSRKDRRALRRTHHRGGRRALRPEDRVARVAEPASTRVAEPAPALVAEPAPALAERSRGGQRARRRRRRRASGLPGTLGITFLGAVIPGTGYLYAGRRLLGAFFLLGWAAVVGGIGWYFGRDWGQWQSAIEFVFDPRALKVAAVVTGVLLLIWVGVVWTSYRLVRPADRPRWHTVVGNLAVVVICVVVAAPAIRAAQYAVATANFVDEVFDNNVTATAPTDVSEKSPWADRSHVNVLLLGGDGGDGRDGVRTDTVILASINVDTGRTVTFSLPRNMAAAQFPEGSPLRDAYPYGFTNGDPASGDYMLNAIYRNVPAMHPGILGNSANEGADAIKQAVEGTLGIPVEYYILVNLDGFKQIVDAMGGVTVNINEPIAIQGNSDAGIPPVDWLEPGPEQHLDGYHALWFARGRYGSDDYERMERQRCMVDALVDAADPANLLVRYIDLLKAGEEVVYTDIPKEIASAFVNLGLKVKDAKVKSVVFRSSEEFNSAEPDFDYIHDLVQRAIYPAPKEPGAEKKSNPAADPKDACAYNPTGETLADVE